jgi:shikimate kinase
MQNGRIFFLDRDLEKLIPTEDRPLGSTGEAIEKRYNERYDLYCASCDFRVDANGDIETVANTITEEFLK